MQTNNSINCNHVAAHLNTLAPYEYGSILESVFNKLIIQNSELENWSQQ